MTTCTGWSLGGIISLEIAHLVGDLGRSSPITVHGIILIDSVPPPSYASPTSHISYMDFVGANVNSSLRTKIQHNMSNSRRMLKAWVFPYGYCANSKSDGQRQLAGLEMARTSQPPVTILLRARERISTGLGQDGFYDTDRNRHAPLLGWERFGHNFIVAVLDIDGHHYSVFEDENVSQMRNELPQMIPFCIKMLTNICRFLQWTGILPLHAGYLNLRFSDKKRMWSLMTREFKINVEFLLIALISYSAVYL